jgi:hypothetical protein
MVAKAADQWGLPTAIDNLGDGTSTVRQHVLHAAAVWLIGAKAILAISGKTDARPG